jgi:STE24 endopeptidase
VALYAIIRHARRLWWAWGAGLTAVAVIFFLLVAPIFIEPIFNTYTPAPDGPVRDAVVELAHRTGTPDDKIYIYDGSKQSDRYTANVSGLFGSARVAMSDVMFAKGADIAEVKGVVGHEMGHYVHMHSLWMAGIMIVMAAIGFWLVDRLYPLARRLLGADRVGDIADPAGLPVLVAILAVLELLSTPLQTTLIRTIEADADHFSMVHANEPDGLSKALIKTAEYRAPSPSAIEEFIFYDHPSVENRIRKAMEWKAAHPPSDQAPTPAR